MTSIVVNRWLSKACLQLFFSFSTSAPSTQINHSVTQGDSVVIISYKHIILHPCAFILFYHLNFNQAWISHNIIQYLGQPAKATHAIGKINQMTKHFISEWATFKLFTLSLCKHNNFISWFQIYVSFITSALTLLSQQNERTLAIWKNTSTNNETYIKNR